MDDESSGVSVEAGFRAEEVFKRERSSNMPSTSSQSTRQQPIEMTSTPTSERSSPDGKAEDDDVVDEVVDDGVDDVNKNVNHDVDKEEDAESVAKHFESKISIDCGKKIKPPKVSFVEKV